MNEAEVMTLLRLIRQGWPDQSIDADAVEFWQGAMEDVTLQQAKAALRVYSKTGKFLPKPAELLEIVATDMVAAGLIPEEAWAEVRREARRVGFNRPPTFHNGTFTRETARFSSPLIARAVEAVGWELICTGDNSRGFVEDRFVKTLAAIARHEVKAAQAGDRIAEPEALPAGIREIARGAD